MLNSRFQILLRRRQNQSEYPPGSGTIVNVIVHCAPLTGFAEYIPGTVDNTSPFLEVTPVGGWYDFTDKIQDAEKLSFSWDKVNTGNSSNSQTNKDGSNYDKGISSDLMFFDSAYHFIYKWLLNNECQILNAVEVKIIDLIARSSQPDPAGNYRIFEIKNDNIDYAPVDEPCQFHIKLREQDNNWHCIHKTFIWDNWQHWFEDSVVKQHPCFLTCIEPRPRLVQSVRMSLMLLYQSSLIMTLIDFIVNIFDLTEDARRVLNANRFVDAPLVRTYIENVAGKCGLSMDTIFDQGQEWENLCLYFPQAGFMHESDDDGVASPSLSYHFDNRWLITIAELFDKLKIVFAAEWYVTPLNTIVFKHTKDLINLLPIYDFTLPGAEPIYNLRYTFNGDKKPAYGRYEYQDDGSDLASQEMSTLYSDIIDYDGPANNPMLEGERIKNFEFAPTGFIRDGRAKDYLDLLIKDGKLGASILLIIITTVIAGLAAGAITLPGAIALTILFWLWFGEIQIKGTILKNEFVDGPTYSGAVRLTSEQVLTPRLILWDGINQQQAKAVSNVGLPIPNPYYNPDLTPYNQKNRIDQDNPNNSVYNYPLYFDGDFYGNLFPKYHDIIDNPLKSLESHQDVKWSVDLCEGMLNLFGVFENQYAVIGKIVKLETRDNYDVYVRIGNINVDYDSNQINLKGTVLRRDRRAVNEERPGNLDSGAEESSGSGVVVPPDEVCLRWINNGESTAEGVRYIDCNGFTIEENILVGGTFCAIEILDTGTGGNIQATDSCEPQESESSGAAECKKWLNLDSVSAIQVSYIDCDGNLVQNQTIGSMEFFCAREIISFNCGNIIQSGVCTDCISTGEYIIQHGILVTDPITAILQINVIDFGDGYIDWGDGTALEPFSITATTGIFNHDFTTPGTYITTFYFNQNATVFTFYNNFTEVECTYFSHSDNFTLFNGVLFLWGVMDISTVIPPAATNIQTVEYHGSANSAATVADFSTLPATVTILFVFSFPLLTTVSNIPSNINQFTFNDNISLVDVDSANNLPSALQQQISVNGNGLVYGTLDLSICDNLIFVQDFSSAQVDAILIALDANGILNGTCQLGQTPDAPPGAGGATAKANLIGKGWTVTTD